MCQGVGVTTREKTYSIFAEAIAAMAQRSVQKTTEAVGKAFGEIKETDEPHQQAKNVGMIEDDDKCPCEGCCGDTYPINEIHDCGDEDCVCDDNWTWVCGNCDRVCRCSV